MKKFTGKYDRIIESTITRYQQGGILSGDLVRFRKDTLKNDKIKALSEQYKQIIEDAMNTDLNLRVSAIKSIRPTTTGYYGGGHNSGTRSPTDQYVDIVVEYAPGLYKNPITVPIEVLEVVDTNGNLAPVPDSVKRKSKSTKPQDVESPDADRKMTDSNSKPDIVAKTEDGRNQVKPPKKVKKKNQGKLTLEDVYGGMSGANPGAEPGAEPGVGPQAVYKVMFGEPYGKNSEEIIKKIQGMEGMSNNMDANFDDDNSLTIKMSGDIEPDTLKKMISNVVKGSVDVSKEDGMTEFEPKSVEIASGSPSIGA